MRKVILLSTLAVLSTAMYANTLNENNLSVQLSVQSQIDQLNQKIEQLQKKQKRTARTLTKVKIHDAYDNIKWNIDFRTAYQRLEYKRKNESSVQNPSLFTNRLWLGMTASPVRDLIFKGQLAMYSTWGGNNLPQNDPFENVNWRASSKPDNLVVKLRQAYFVYTFNKDSNHPISISAGRRPATDGFLANHREDTENPGSPLAHITNMEVDAGMIKVANLFGLEGSYVKFVAGRSYDNINQASYSGTPYTDVNATDADVNFFVMPMCLYNDGQYDLMAQYTYINDFMGSNDTTGQAITGAGDKHMGALSLEVDGLDEDIDFLDDSTFFISGAFTTSVPKSGYRMLGSKNTQTGYSFWTGFIMPDMVTDNGHLGFEYNYGSKYWAPMTWAEDTLSESKIATRGSAYEVYWNLPILSKYLSAQLRYTYMDYKYKSNIDEFWAKPTLQDGDPTSAQDLRLSLRYRY
ncbi:DUF3373 family protein [Sulfurimonas sp.]